MKSIPRSHIFPQTNPLSPRGAAKRNRTSNALILGSLMLFAVMAAVTRNADWYKGLAEVMKVAAAPPPPPPMVGLGLWRQASTP